jgi:hypothetical protein
MTRNSFSPSFLTRSGSSRLGTVAAALIAITLVPQLRAQSPVGGAIAANMSANTEKLKNFTFKQKVEVYLKGELKKTSVSQVHYDSSGQRVAVPLESAPAEASQSHHGPVARKVAEEKKDEMKDYVDRLMGLTSQYLPPTADRIQATVSRAQFSQPVPGEAQVKLPDYLKDGDSMTMTLEAAEKRITQVEVKSSLDSDPVSIVVNFSALPDGTNYPATTTVKSEAKQVELRISTYDYQPQPK